jgi:hypothetical protein
MHEVDFWAVPEGHFGVAVVLADALDSGSPDFPNIGLQVASIAMEDKLCDTVTVV